MNVVDFIFICKCMFILVNNVDNRKIYVFIIVFNVKVLFEVGYLC